MMNDSIARCTNLDSCTCGAPGCASDHLSADPLLGFSPDEIIVGPNGQTLAQAAAADIAAHDALCASLAAADGIPRLTWEQHGAAFAGPVIALARGQQVVAWDSATPGTVGQLCDGRYDVTFAEFEGVCRYAASQLRPWPIAARTGGAP